MYLYRSDAGTVPVGLKDLDHGLSDRRFALTLERPPPGVQCRWGANWGARSLSGGPEVSGPRPAGSLWSRSGNSARWPRLCLAATEADRAHIARAERELRSVCHLPAPWSTDQRVQAVRGIHRQRGSSDSRDAADGRFNAGACRGSRSRTLTACCPRLKPTSSTHCSLVARKASPCVSGCQVGTSV
jgi:hypothetical protein